MIYSDFCGKSLSRLGFGMMRLPQNEDGSVDEKATEEMIACAIKNGINYFDTAYPYHNGQSEKAVGKFLTKYPRESYYLADKYPGHQYADEYIPSTIFEEQLKKCNTDYFDFYLLHNVYENSIPVYEDPKWGIVDYFVKQKEAGRIKHLGFSSHARSENLRKFLEYCGDKMEFCQIQLNYLDWKLQDAKEKCAILEEYNIPVWVMEPLRGGRLSNLAPEDSEMLHKLRPDDSDSSWAFRYLMSNDQVKVILSGMSNMNQMLDNIKIFEKYDPLSEDETNLLYAIGDKMVDAVPCTACRYCTTSCPMGLDIPMLIHAYNDAKFQRQFTVGMQLDALPENKLPKACLGCGACAKMCPQGIDIPKVMSDFAQLHTTLPNWAEICKERAEAAKKG